MMFPLTANIIPELDLAHFNRVAKHFVDAASRSEQAVSIQREICSGFRTKR
jgi:hypothetical protein